MRIKLTLALHLAFVIFTNAQQKETPGIFGKDFTIKDRFGRDYTFEQILLPPNHTQAITCVAGSFPGPIFELTFEDEVLNTGIGFDDPAPGQFSATLGEDRQMVACQVFTDISAALVAADDPYTVPSVNNPTQRVRILIRQSTNWGSDPIEQPGVLGYASPFLLEAAAGVHSPTAGTIWQMINSGFDPWYGLPAGSFLPPPNPPAHGFIRMNFNHTFYNDLGNAIPSTTADHDLYSVLLHEATHGLGLLSLIDANGASRLWPGNFTGPYSIFDTYLRSTSGSNPLLQSSGTSQFNGNWSWNCNTSLVPLYTSTTCGITFSGLNNACSADYTQSTWSPGSSLSHFDMNCNPTTCSSSPTYVMHPDLPAGVMRRTYSQEEIRTLCDLHYVTTGNFGGTLPLSTATYSSGICGFRVAGVNDFRPYSADNNNTAQNFTVPAATTITFTQNDFLANDVNADSYTNLEVIRGFGSVIPISPTSFSFTGANNFFGNVVISYVPVNNNGQHGQATYIILRVNAPTLTGCPLQPNECNFICNGDFENSYGYGDFTPNPTNNGVLAAWQQIGTSDLYTRNSPDPICDIPNNNLGSGLEVWDAPNPANNHYVHFGGFINGNSEGIQQQLTNPLLSGHTYTLTLHVMNMPPHVTGGYVNSNFLVYTNSSQAPGNNSLVGTFQIAQPVPADFMWHTYSIPITPSGNESWLIIRNPVATTNNIGFLIDNVSLFENPVPVDAGPDINYCTPAPTNIPLTATTCSNANLTYSWTDGTNTWNTQNIQVSPTVTTTYTVTVTNTSPDGDYSYTGSDQVTIFVHPLPAVTIATTGVPICNGGSATLTASGGQSYIWSDGSTTASITVSPSVTATYTVTGFDAFGCQNTATVNVTVGNPPSITVTASPSNVSCSGTPVTLTASGASTYSWSPAVSCSSPCSTAVVTPTATTTYTVVGTDPIGCTAASSVTVTYAAVSNLCCSAPNVVLPINASSNSFPGNTIAPGNIVDVTGIFIINGNVTYNNVIFRMSTNAVIQVSPSASLTLDGCHLFSCSDMWNGIYLLQAGNNAGGLSMKNFTSMEDAFNGIVGNSGNTNISSVIDIKDCSLNKNYINIQVSNYTTGNNTPYSLTIRRTSFSCASSSYSPGNTLKTNSALAQRTKVGVAIDNVRLVTIGVPANNCINTFSNMDYGVYAVKSAINVFNNQFLNLAGNVQNCGNPPCTPFGVGVFVPNISPADQFIITVGGSGNKTNLFKEVYRAVDVRNVGQLYVINNMMTNTTTPPVFNPSLGNLTSEFAVRASVVKATLKVTDNHINNFFYGVAFGRNNPSGTFNPLIEISGNTITTSGSGYVSNGILVFDNPGNNITAILQSILIRDNTLSDVRDIGIYCRHILNKPVVASSPSGTQSLVMRFNNAGTVMGIFMEGCYNAIVDNNSVFSTSYSNPRMYGIYLRNSKYTLARCNNIGTIGTCIAIEGNCGSAYQPPQSNFGILSNHFYDALMGIYMTNSAVLGPQGDPSHPMGNQWLSPLSIYSLGQTRTDNSVNPVGNEFYCNQNTQEFPTANFGTPPITVSPSAGNAPNCPGPSQRIVSDEPYPGDELVLVHPNPSSGLFEIEAVSDEAGMDICVYDLLGTLVLKKHFDPSERMSVDLGDYSDGVYFMHIISGSGLSVVKKIIREK
jgi:hypothetical protein